MSYLYIMWPSSWQMMDVWVSTYVVVVVIVPHKMPLRDTAFGWWHPSDNLLDWHCDFYMLPAMSRRLPCPVLSRGFHRRDNSSCQCYWTDFIFGKVIVKHQSSVLQVSHHVVPPSIGIGDQDYREWLQPQNSERVCSGICIEASMVWWVRRLLIAKLSVCQASVSIPLPTKESW